MKTTFKNPFHFDREVSGNQFCGREKDIKKLKNYITDGTNVIMFAKRRIGKSSLVKEVFQNHLSDDILKAHIDIYSVSNSRELYGKIKEGISDSLKSEETSLDKLQALVEGVQEYFTTAKVSLKISATPSIDIEPLDRVYEDAIGELLNGYFNFLEAKNLQAVIAIDEFQKIVSLSQRNKIEEVLRTVINKRKNCAFIFTGSKRRILLSMFNNPDRPFYKLGLEHNLKPIQEEVFYKWTSNHFKKKEIILEEEAFAYLYAKAKGETRFMQLVSYRMFNEVEPLEVITIQIIKEFINEIVEGASMIQTYFNKFSIIQQNTLKIIAKSKGVNIYSAEMLREYDVKKPSVQNAVSKLLDEAVVYEDNNAILLENVELSIWLESN